MSAEWSRVPLKAVASANDEVLSETFGPDELISYVEISDVSEVDGIRWGETMRFGDAPSRARRVIRNGDVLVSTVRTYLRAVAPVVRPPLNPVASTGFAVVRPRRVDHEFLGYALLADEFMEEVISRSVGVSYPAINTSDVMSITVALPSPSVQRGIVKYLDRETAEIDAFIADQEQLIALLEERRIAAVANLIGQWGAEREAGDRWFGRLPTGWTERRMKDLSVVKRGASPRPIDDPKYFDENGEWAWVRIQDVTASGGALQSTSSTLSALGASLSVKLEPGSLFVSIAATVGVPCVTEIKCCIHDGFAYFPRLDERLVPYLYRVFVSGLPFGGLGKLGTQVNLNTETVGGISIPLPPAAVLPEVVSALDAEAASLKAAIADAREVIALSKERRSALISAAVTGRIDTSERKRVLV